MNNKNLILALLLLSSCSWINQDKKIARQNQVEKFAHRDTSDIQIIWKAPEKKVDKYFIYYGYNENSLVNKQEVLVSELRKITGLDNTTNYSYTLKNIDKDKPVYFSLQAQNSKGLSPATKVMRVEIP
ncbi:MAG: fibronectin type III domain-containing protein [Proteobacteria bacterium]|nr:fibronectin type III domain-containing protein [Pseudomonadota bacterium]